MCVAPSKEVPRADELPDSLRKSLHIVRDSNKVTLSHIWNSLDLEPRLDDLADKIELSQEVLGLFQILFSILLTMMPILETVLNFQFFAIMATLVSNIANEHLENAQIAFGIMFNYILPLKQITTLKNIRDFDFIPHVYKHHEALEMMRLNVWNEMQEIKIVKNINEDDIDVSIQLARDAFRVHFIRFLNEYYPSFSRNASNNLYLDTCIMHDIDVVHVRYKPHLRKSFLERNRNNEFILWKPSF